MAKRAGRATWWKMHHYQRDVLESVPDKDAGSGLKAAFQYFDGESVDEKELTPSAFTVFCMFRPCIDEAKRDYENSVSSGKNGANNRWNSGSPPIAPLNAPMGEVTDTEEDVEEDLERDLERDKRSIYRGVQGGAEKSPLTDEQAFNNRRNEAIDRIKEYERSMK